MNRLSFSHPVVRATFCIFLVLLPLLTAWNLAVAPNRPKLEIKIGPKLAGVTRQLPLNWSLSSLIDGSLQKALTERITQALPIRPLLVRFNNELKFELFGELTLPGVVRGAHGHLIEQFYLDDYCNRTEGMVETRARATIPKLKAVQDYYRSRGIRFHLSGHTVKGRTPAGLLCESPGVPKHACGEDPVRSEVCEPSSRGGHQCGRHRDHDPFFERKIRG